MTENLEHVALAVTSELQPGTWAFHLEDGDRNQLRYTEFAASGPFEGDVIDTVVRDYLAPLGLVVDGVEKWEDHDGRWTAIIDR